MRRCLGPALLLIFLPRFALGQYTAPDTPPDSPLWWPVFDGITAEELHTAHQEDAVRELYATAVASGRAPECEPDYVPYNFRDSGANPELVPLWYAFDSAILLRWRTLDQRPDLDEEGLLREVRLSASGTETLRHFARNATEEMLRRDDLLKETTRPMYDAIFRFEEKNPPLPEEEWPAAVAALASPSAEVDRQRLEAFPPCGRR